jgi:septum site-determining protein MinC
MDAQTEFETVRSPETSRGKTQAFEIKGMVAPLTALRLRTADTGAIAKQLIAKVAQMPQFFQDAAVLVDLGSLGPDAGKVHFGQLAALLRSCKMVPVAVTNVDGDARTQAVSAGFGYVSPPTRASGRTVEVQGPVLPEVSAPVDPAPVPEAAIPEKLAADASPRRARGAHRPPLVVRQQVRSGQVIHAVGTDLVVLAPVNSGAEVIADGHVHVYSTLRGRAVAGAQGMTDARIFCQKLDAELVAIAGAYLLAEDLPAEHKGKPVQIYLEEGICRVVPL